MYNFWEKIHNRWSFTKLFTTLSSFFTFSFLFKVWVMLYLLVRPLAVNCYCFGWFQNDVKFKTFNPLDTVFGFRIGVELIRWNQWFRKDPRFLAFHFQELSSSRLKKFLLKWLKPIKNHLLIQWFEGVISYVAWVYDGRHAITWYWRKITFKSPLKISIFKIYSSLSLLNHRTYFFMDCFNVNLLHRILWGSSCFF